MKSLDNTKKVVLTIGFVALVFGIVGMFNTNTPITQFFPLYSGFTLIGTTLLHKEKATV